MLVYQRVKYLKIYKDSNQSWMSEDELLLRPNFRNGGLPMAELELVFSELFSATSAGQCTNIYI